MFCVSEASLRYTKTWAPFSWTLRMLELRGQFGTLVNEQVYHDLYIRLWGAKELYRRPAYIGAERARTHLLFYSETQ